MLNPLLAQAHMSVQNISCDYSWALQSGQLPEECCSQNLRPSVSSKVMASVENMTADKKMLNKQIISWSKCSIVFLL